jgi:hypothetical protein
MFGLNGENYPMKDFKTRCDVADTSADEMERLASSWVSFWQ